jgi:molecular chaperone DnaJ
MTAKRDYYEVLGVTRTSTRIEIDKAYRRLAIKFHPDSNRDDQEATTKFKEATEAYEVLSDAEKRQRYDRYGHAGVDASVGQYADVNDIFDAFGGMFEGTIFGDLFGQSVGGRRGKRVRRGADLRCDLTLTLEEAVRGTKKQLRLRRHSVCGKCGGSGAAVGSQPEPCRRCGGRGQVVQNAGFVRVQTTCPSCGGAGTTIGTPCDGCEGSGLEEQTVTLEVEIPAGVDDGMRVRLPGEGDPSPDGGPPGDCYCFVGIEPHSLFQREGSHLLLSLPISYAQAVLGAELDVPTLDGSRKLQIEPGTHSGDVLRLRGLGVPDPRGGRRGDLLVHVQIEVPKKVSPRQRELLQELAELEHESVLPQKRSFLEKIKGFFEGSSEPTDAPRQST